MCNSVEIGSRHNDDDQVILLFPSDVLRPARVDDHFAAEAAAARAAGIEVSYVDHDAMTRPGGAEQAVRRVSGSGDALYRGWMVGSARYAEVDAALRRRGVTLRTGEAHYRRAHELPGWYEALAAVTPLSVWTTEHDRAAFDRACAELGAGPAVVRDHTKSMKHHWDEAMFIPDVADRDGAWAVARRFRELRGDDLQGGFVLRRFERFVSAEVRTWWVDGVCRLTGPHPDAPDGKCAAEVDLTAVEPLVAGLRLPFVTVDLALRDDGAWRVVELGDGQVSDRPRSLGAETFVGALI